jgi:hypothetical protein
MIRPSRFHRHYVLRLVPALLLLSVLMTTGCMRDDVDRIVNGGQFPPGWSARPDRGTPQQLGFTQAGDVFHFVVGPAGTFYNPEWTKSGDYTYSARMTQLKPASHQTSYGIIFGGSNLDKPNLSYSYFLVRQKGEYYVANKDGDAGPKAVVGWTAHNAIVKEGGDGRQVNTLGIEVQGNNMLFKVNGQEVTRLDKSKVHADGLIGFRIGHNLDVDADQIAR